MAQQGDSDTGNTLDHNVITAIKLGYFKIALSLVESFNADKSMKFTWPNSLTLLYLKCQQQVHREFTPLHIVAALGHLGLFQYLLDLLFTNIPPLSQEETLWKKKKLLLNLRTNMSDSFSDTPLHVASRRGNLDIVKLLTDTLRCNPDSTNGNVMSCLHLAAQNGHLDMVRYLIEEKGSDSTLINADGKCPSYLAAEQGHLNVLKYMIEDGGSDPHFKKKEKRMMLGTPGMSLVHAATEGGHLHVIRYLIDHHGCNPFGQDNNGITPLHLACENMEIVKYLITEANCDPSCVSKYGVKCLHTASERAQLDQCISISENTPLHYAVERYANLDVVKLLLKSFICDPLAINCKGETALDRAKYMSIKSYLHQASTISTNIIAPAINIFAVENSGSGKSTLVKAISQDKNFLKKVFNLKVKGVVPLTPGIVHTTIDHEIFGRANIFDFAGHEEYYASHEMILCQSYHPLVLLVINISLSLHEVEKQLLYWLAILSNASANETCKILHVMIIGSHVDLINKSTTSKIENLISTTIKSNTSIHYCGLINFDCRYSTSSGMEQLCLQLSNTSESIRSDIAKNESDESMKLCTAIMDFITNELSIRKGAISISELWKQYRFAASTKDLDYIDLPWCLRSVPLHNNIVTFTETCQKLSLNGNILFIPHEHNMEESLLVLDNDIQVHACLKKIQQNISNDLGMLEESKLRDILSDSLVDTTDPTQAIEYLKVSQFCTEITPDQLLSAPDRIDRENYYFFPNLVLATRPSSSTLWRTEEGGHEYTDLYTWCMECTNAGQFFTPRYIHTLFIQLVKCESGSDHAQYIIWKNGILLVHSNLTRCVIEVTDQTTHLYITLQCEKGREIYLVKQRSFLISLVKSLKNKACPEVESRELLFSPTHSYPPVLGSDSVPVTVVAHSVLAGLPAVATRKDSTNINQVRISELLHFDSLNLNDNEIENNTTLQSVLINSRSIDIVPSFEMDRVCSTMEPHIGLIKMLQVDPGDVSYKQLYEVLLKYTIFSDDTLIKLAGTEPTFNTPPCPIANDSPVVINDVKDTATNTESEDNPVSTNVVNEEQGTAIGTEDKQSIFTDDDSPVGNDEQDTATNTESEDNPVSTKDDSLVVNEQGLVIGIEDISTDVNAPTIKKLTLMKWKDSQGQSKEIRIIEECSHKWRTMGNLLGIPSAKLTSYQTAHLNRNEACCEEVLLYWLGGRGSREYSVTWDGFHELLEDIDLVALAEKLSQALQAMQN